MAIIATVGRGGVNMASRLYAIWLDFNGVTRQTVLNSTASAAAVLTALQAKSEAEVLNYVESALSTPIGVAAAAQYQSVKSAATLLFQTGAGTIVRVTIPAPAVGIFLADQQTVDPAQVAAIIAAAVGTLTDISGNVVTSYLGGTLEPARNDLPPAA